MKATKWLILLLLVFCRCNIVEKEKPNPEYPILDVACLPKMNDRYVYSIMPGTIDWQQLPKGDLFMATAYEACQLPDDVLKSISTLGLVDALIRAPLFQLSKLSVPGWQNHYRKFNSALELFQREDAGDALVYYYRSINFNCGVSVIAIDGIEMLFTQQEILNKIGSEKKREVVSLILTKYEMGMKDDYYYFLSHSLSPLVYLMYADEYEPIVQYSKDNPENFNELLMGAMNYQHNLIVSYAKSYIYDANNTAGELDPLDFYICSPEVNDRYVYPIMPATPEWQQLPKGEFFMAAAYEACQLPDDVLKSISTQGLVDALAHAPLFSTAGITSISIITAWQTHFNRFNSGLELFQREDAGDAIVDYYKLMNWNCVANLPWYLRQIFSMIGVEMLFTKQEILDTMGHDKKQEAVAAIMANYEQYNYGYSLFPIVYIMYADEYEPIVQYSQNNPENFNYLLRGVMNYQQDLVVSYAKSYINDKN